MKYSAPLFILLILNFSILEAQNQQKIDSLTQHLDNVTSDIDRIDLYNEISYEYRKTDSLNTTTFANRAIDLAKKINYNEGISDAYIGLAGAAKYAGHYPEAKELFKKALESAPSKDLKRKGNARNGLASISRREGNYKQALEYYLKNLDIYKSINDKVGLSATYNNMGVTYEVLGDKTEALENFETSLELNLELNDQQKIARSYTNLGVIYSQENNHEKALQYFNNAMEIQRKLGDEGGLAISYVNIGAIYENKNLLNKAIESYKLGLDIFRKNNSVRNKMETLNNLSSAYAKTGEINMAILCSEEAYRLASEIGDMKNIKNSSKELHTNYATRGSYKTAYKQLLIFKEMSDNINNQNNIEERTKLVLQHSFDREKDQIEAKNEKNEAVKDLEIQKQNADLANQRLGLLAAGGGVLLLILLVSSIRKGKKRSDELLHNILPKEVASELKRTGKAETKKYENVSILFTDFKGFTALVASIPATKLVEELNHIFGRFDDIMDEFEIEKIETIGDAYMAACGLPIENVDHALRCIQAAQKMLDFLDERNLTSDIQWNMRVGVHSGPVVAGVVGKKKFAYDLFGDSVNTASRMESNGEPGKINISQTTYALSKDEPSFSFENRGQILAKGKGEMAMWFVNKATPQQRIA